MHAMQYEITLPADYDMDIIRERVASKGHLLDDFPGLGVKTYLMRERGVLGSPVNQYAPFYLWNTESGMNSFLWGAGFQGIVRDFGRPVVQHWNGVAYAEGVAPDARARVAVRERKPITETSSLPALVAGLTRETAELAAEEGVLFAAAGIDPRTWELLRFSVREHAEPGAPGTSGDIFQVLHVSQPERDRLPKGNQW
ncbi:MULTISPECIES: DUF4865 family protein [unclassified Streptomyces]|uniref:DUF4865 family protein n=1 Tax=unclassified Streptomyces TaxID=2593676 RepID=UPI000DB99807|nr:DUF4865 family protein [Streptomyces sp. PsTaAH-137]MYT75105.1 DUF4865 family protein [Streptomyces sp. SID8367]RAJ77062.1 uncharacterized protein DUF4865 [Streptomyces sp. PsTaAH-137]